MLQYLWPWFVGAALLFDLLAAFLSVCPSFFGHCIAAALKDTLFYRATGLIERNDELVMAAGTIAVAVFTYTLWRTTERLWRAGEQQIALAQSSAETTRQAAETTRQALEHTRTAERAYVKMSHMPIGLVFTTDGRVGLNMRVKNYGRTPATVTDVFLTPFLNTPGARLPVRPTYEGINVLSTTSAFLMVRDHIFIEAVFPLAEYQQVLVRKWTLYLFGYVDYIDGFDQRHRGGYARMFVPERPDNNLVFINDRSFNYDVVRQRGEGRDWS